MLYYPQLSTGSACQFPFARRTYARTVSNDLLGGASIRTSDPGAELFRWQLQYSGLTDTEWSSIEQLFLAVEGQLNTFTFLDPADNLILWSEDWTQPQWVFDPLLQLSTGIQDPLAGNGAAQLTNTGQASLSVVQLLNAPSWFQYCYSIYLRSDVPASVDVLATTAGQDLIATVTVGT